MEEETFEARLERLAGELRQAEPGCTVIVFAARAVSKAPHSPIIVVMKGDDTTANLGLVQIGSDMARSMIYHTLGLTSEGDVEEA